jgi:hypothetical protein
VPRPPRRSSQWTLGDLAGARAEYERALEVGEATLAPDHPNLAILRRNLDSVLQQLAVDSADIPPPELPLGPTSCRSRTLSSLTLLGPANQPELLAAESSGLEDDRRPVYAETSFEVVASRAAHAAVGPGRRPG